MLRGYTVEVDHELGVVVLGLGLETRNWGFRVFFFLDGKDSILIAASKWKGTNLFTALVVNGLCQK